MADLPKNTTIEGYKIVTPRDLEPYKSVSLSDNEFILVSKADNRYSIIYDTTSGVTPKNGDFAYNSSSMYVFFSGGWFELVLGNDGINPPGAIVPFAQDSIPDGYLECNGRTLSRSTYSVLFAAVGTLHGSGNGSTTFNIPELRGEFIRGWDNNRGVDRNRSFGSLQASEFKSHKHGGNTNTTGNHRHYVVNDQSNTEGGTRYRSDGRGGVSANTYIRTTSAGLHKHTLNINSTGGNDTYPKNVALVFCIKS